MKIEEFIYKDQKKLRCGYTTGSCAAAAAKAAAILLLLGKKEESISIMTPGGFLLHLPVEQMKSAGNSVFCAIKKDSGDDADVTNGILIGATVKKNDTSFIHIEGGTGIGHITRAGLEQKIGEAAINRVPRQMITQAVEEIMEEAEYEGGIDVIISAPEGMELAKKTFNPALGIEGGISILGTSGIVEPMSEKALIDTIRLEMKMQAAEGRDWCVMTPGNYGSHFISNTLQLNLNHTVKCSNFIGDAIDFAWENHMKEILLAGHLGKLVKLGSGIMNTHSRYADGRMETLCACAVLAGASCELSKMILQCITTDEAVALLLKYNILERTMKILMEKIAFHLQKRAGESMRIEAVVFSNQFGMLGTTSGAENLISKIKDLQ